jgi:TolA-binding protein
MRVAGRETVARTSRLVNNIHMKRLFCTLAFSLLLLPAVTFAASKEQLEMQRDIADVQDQVRKIQSTLDQKLSSMQTLIEQSLESGHQTGRDVSSLGASVKDMVDRELKDALRPIAGLVAKVDNLNNDSSEVRNSLTDLNAQMNRVLQKLTDIDNAIKVLQAPAPPPPTVQNSDAGVPQNGAGRLSAVPPAGLLWGNANNDYSSAKYDLAAGEFADFVRNYPDDASAPKALVYLGQIHLMQMKYDLAVMDFDSVLERYPESKENTPDAYFMKGMALKYLGRRNDAADQFRTVIRKYPHSDRKPEAEEALKQMGLSAAAAPAAARKKK